MPRRFLVFALLAAVAVVLLLGTASVAGHPREAPAAAVSNDVVGAVASPATADLPSPAAGVADADQHSPCVVRADCAGALLLGGGLGLVLALPVMTPALGLGPAPATPVAGSARLLRSRLWAARLHRPPQAS